MKLNQLKVLLLTIFIYYTIACNNSEQNITKATTESATINDTLKKANKYDCEYYVDEQTAGHMIADFLKRYKKAGTTGEVRGLNTEFWIDSCIITALRNFFDTANSNYDGIRIFQTGNRNSGLLVVPTSRVIPPSVDYEHTNRHDEASKIPLRVGCIPLISINLDKNSSEKLINDFGEKFRKESTRGNRKSSKHDSLSAAVWFDKCKINLMANLLEDGSNDVNGIIVYAASYLKMQSNASRIRQKYDRQSAMILVPGKKSGSSYIPRWSTVLPPPTLASDVYSGGYNHGQLCPNNCE